MPPKTGVNESAEWTAVSTMLTAQVAPKRWWAVHLNKLEMAPTLLDAEDFYLDREESDSALARKMGGKRRNTLKKDIASHTGPPSRERNTHSNPAIENVPFVNRPFESEIHGTVNFTYFCCFLLVTWCYCVLLSCYLRPK